MSTGRTTVYAVALCAVLALALSSCAGSVQTGKADRAYALGNYDDAAKLYQQAHAESPRNAEIMQKLNLSRQHAAAHHKYLGDVALEETRLMNARAEFQTALDYNPQLAEAKQSLDNVSQLLESISRAIDEAKALSAQVKWLEAAGKLAPVCRYDKDFPDARAMCANAVEQAYTNAMNEGKAAYDKEDFVSALSFFTEAAAAKPDDQRAKEMIAAAQNQIYAMELATQGAALLQTGDWRGAVEKYAAALDAAPGGKNAAEGLKRAKETGAKALLAEGTGAIAAGKLAKAVLRLDEAAALVPDYPGVADSRAKARRALADKMFAAGERYEKTGRVASALACYKTVIILVPDYPNIAAKVAAGDKDIDQSANYDAVVSFREPNNALEMTDSKYNDLKKRVLEKLHDLLAGGRVRIITQEELDSLRQMNPDYTAGGALTVMVKPPHISRDEPKRERRTVRYVSSSRSVENPDYEQLRRQVEQDSGRVLELEQQIDGRQRDLDRAERDEKMVEEQWHATTKDDPKKEPLARQLARLQDDVSRARDRLNSLERLHDDLVYRVRDGQNRLQRTPRFISEKTYADYTYDVVTNRITATQSVLYTLEDEELNTQLVSDKMTDEQRAEAEAVKGFEPAGIVAKTGELPSKNEMEGRVADDLASRLPDDLASDLRKFPLRYLRMAEAAERAGDKEAAFDCYARYAFVCRVMGLSAMPRLAEIDAMVAEHTGYSPLNAAADLRNLPQ